MKFTQLVFVAAMALTAAASPADIFRRPSSCVSQGNRCTSDSQCCKSNGSKYLTCDSSTGTCRRLKNWSCRSNADCCTGTSCQPHSGGWYCRPHSSPASKKQCGGSKLGSCSSGVCCWSSSLKGYTCSTQSGAKKGHYCPATKQCGGHQLGSCSYGVCCWSTSLKGYTCSTQSGAKKGNYCPVSTCGGSAVGTCPSGETCCKTFAIGDRWTYKCSKDSRATYGGTCPSGSGPGAICSPTQEGTCSTGVCCKVLSIGDKYTWTCSTDKGATQGYTCPGVSRWT
jgi:hypothetical protein